VSNQSPRPRAPGDYSGESPGGAYLEEIRRAIQPLENPQEPRPPSAELVEFARPSDEQPGSFDAGAVLARIDRGEVDSSGGLVHSETVRLLAVACQKLVAGPMKKPPTP
jgi:hypothetical protein